MSDLKGLPIRYVVDWRPGNVPLEFDNEHLTVVHRGYRDPVVKGSIPAKVVSLTGSEFGPFLDEAQGIADPNNGMGYWKNIHYQCEKAQRQGFKLVVLSDIEDVHFDHFAVKRAIDVILTYRMGVILKNPMASSISHDDLTTWISHINTFGIIVEQNCGNPVGCDTLRKAAGKPDLPVWFVATDHGVDWAEHIAADARNFVNMGVTVSTDAFYWNSSNILIPRTEVNA